MENYCIYILLLFTLFSWIATSRALIAVYFKKQEQKLTSMHLGLSTLILTKESKISCLVTSSHKSFCNEMTKQILKNYSYKRRDFRINSLTAMSIFKHYIYLYTYMYVNESNIIAQVLS